MTPLEAAEEMRRLSSLPDKGLAALRDTATDLASAEHAYRKARARAWVELDRTDTTAKEKEDQVNAATADARLGRDTAEGLRQAALEAVRSRRTQISALQSLLAADRAEAEFARTGTGGCVVSRPSQRRFPFAPLDDLTGWSAREWAALVGVAQRTIVRWRVEGLPESRADALAVLAGESPWTVWPDLWEDADARRRRQARERMRRLYRNDAAYRARQLARRRAYYRECGEYERAQQRRRYQQKKGAA